LYDLVEMAYDDDEEETETLKEVLAKGSAIQRKPAKELPCSLGAELQSLIKLITDNDMFKEQMQEFKIDMKKMPLGKISKAQLAKGFAVLEEIEAAIKAGKSGSVLAELSSRFYTVIPQDFGRTIPPVMKTPEEVQQKNDLLEVLGDIEVAQKMLSAEQDKSKNQPDSVPHPLDVAYEKLNNTLELVPKNSAEFKMISTYLNETKSSYSKLEIIDVFKLNRQAEFERFKQHKSLKNRKLLWHGTKVAVCVAILKGGLRIMPHSGGRVGRGLYFASENAKSAGYVGTSGNIGIMFLNEVALGKQHVIYQDDSSLRAPPKGYDSVLAKGRVEPDESKDTTYDGPFGPVTVPQGKALNTPHANSSFFNSEYLVYDEAQVYMRYLLKIKFG